MPKFSFFRSLRFKFGVATGLVFLLIFSVASYILIQQNSDFERNSLLARANTFAALATKPLGDAYNIYFHAGNLKFQEISRDTLELNTTVPRAQIVSVDGTVLFDSNDALAGIDTSQETKVNDEEVLNAVVKETSTQLTDDEGNISEIIVPYSTDFGSRPFSIRYFISYESIYENINKAIQTTLIFVVIIFLVTLIMTTLLVNRSILTPLGKIVSIAREISEGNLNKEIVINTKDELNDLATSLNQMTQSLRKNIDELKEVDKLKNEFIMIASHNLRTPLTVIKGFVPFLRDKKMDKDMEEVVDGIQVSAEKLEAVTESLLDIVALEGESKPLKKTAEDLVSVVKDALEPQKLAAEKKKVTINAVLPPSPVAMQLDKTRMKHAISGILDNAIKFNKENGKVDVKLEVVGSNAQITVIDTGVGISPEEQQKMFQKFHRGTDVLTYNYEGLGLSLYITKVVIESHGGSIAVESALGKGTKVTVVLPI